MVRLPSFFKANQDNALQNHKRFIATVKNIYDRGHNLYREVPAGGGFLVDRPRHGKKKDFKLIRIFVVFYVGVRDVKKIRLSCTSLYMYSYQNSLKTKYSLQILCEAVFLQNYTFSYMGAQCEYISF